MPYGREISDGFTPHSTRHTAATLLVRSADIKTAGEILEHSSAKMTMLYTHSEENLKRRALDTLGEVLTA